MAHRCSTTDRPAWLVRALSVSALAGVLASCQDAPTEVPLQPPALMAAFATGTTPDDVPDNAYVGIGGSVSGSFDINASLPAGGPYGFPYNITSATAVFLFSDNDDYLRKAAVPGVANSAVNCPNPAVQGCLSETSRTPGGPHASLVFDGGFSLQRFQHKDVNVTESDPSEGSVVAFGALTQAGASPFYTQVGCSSARPRCITDWSLGGGVHPGNRAYDVYAQPYISPYQWHYRDAYEPQISGHGGTWQTTVVLDAAAIADLAADGILGFVVSSSAGDFELVSSDITFEIEASSNTPIGSPVVVAPDDETTGQLSPVVLTFDNVTGPGETTVTSSAVGGGGPPAPSQFRLGTPPTSFDIQTTASFTGSVEICIDYSGVSYGNESLLTLLHFDGDWVDGTTSLDTVNDIICGSFTSLSPFLVAEPNLAPVVTAVNLNGAPVALGDNVAITASFLDENLTDTHTATIDWDDGQVTVGVVTEPTGTTLGAVSGGHVYTLPGVYTVTVTVTEDVVQGENLSGSRSSDEESTNSFVVVYDPDGGFVTGGGWFNSLPGAFKADELITGKAKFGFVSKYKNGATVPTGNTEFQFKAGDLNFHSSSYEWLVVNQNGQNAQFTGEGTINGTGVYKFMLWAGDGDPDTFRIRITEVGGGVIYDNDQAGAGDQPIDGGSIKIHTN